MDDLTTLQKKMKGGGYHFTKLPGGHIGIYTPTGQRLKYEDGRPLNFPNTPSDHRVIENLEANLRKAGVDVDNLVKPKGKSAGGRKAGVKLGAPVTSKEAGHLRARLKAVMHDYKLTQADVYNFADALAAEQKRYLPSSPAGMISKFLQGTTPTERSFEWLDKAVKEITFRHGTGPLTNGKPAPLPADHTPVPEDYLGAVTTTQDVGVEPVGESKVKVTLLPKLALETMAWIYRPDKDPDAIAALVEEIAKLELS